MTQFLKITEELSVPKEDLHFKFKRSSGPGGQNVNKVSTAVQLRFDVQHSRWLSTAVKQRLRQLASGKMTREGILLIEAQRHRTQERNREEAVRRFVALLRQAAHPPKRRLRTFPTATAKQKRLEAKKRRSTLKKMRSRVRLED